MANGNGHVLGPLVATDPNALPPQNLEAERSVIGCILYDSEDALPKVIDWLHPADFYRDAHQIIYQAILDAYERFGQVDFVILSAELERQGQTENTGGDDYLETCARAVPHAANCTYYAELIREKKVNRDLEELSTENIRDARSNQFTADELLARASKRFTIIESVAAVESDDEFNLNPAPGPMRSEAFRGLVGDIVGRIAPETEACPEAILGQFLVGFGNLIGRRAHWRINATCHRANLNLCLVGATGSGRKGTAWDCTHWLLGLCEPEWALKPTLSGLTSGEGLIDYIKANPGPVLAVETEFGRLLANCRRENNTLSHVLRQAFDGGNLSVPTRKDARFVSDVHFSIIGHITYSELLSKIQAVDIENGMVNRFLWLHSYRVGSLPEGGDFRAATEALAQIGTDLSDSVIFARDLLEPFSPYVRDAAARKMWAPLYEQLTEPMPGRYGNAVERRAPLVMRLAMIYAVLDRERSIRPPHIEAALAFWDYCDGTARRIFGDVRRDKNLVKLRELLDAAPAGLTKTQIRRKLAGGHLTQIELDRVIEAAELTGKYTLKETKTGGRTKHTLIHRKYLLGAAK